MRILNTDRLISHGNIEGRKHILEIMEAGLCEIDPYYNTLNMLKIENGKLSVGYPDFVPKGSPRSGIDVYDLDTDLDRIFVFGAGKGIHRSALAIEEVLGEYLTGGHIIIKHGDKHNLKKIGVTHAGHPIADECSVAGSKKMVEMIDNLNLTNRDLVLTIIGNGASSLMTLPVDGIEFREIQEITEVMQIKKGLPTTVLNYVRNQVDQLKGGRITKKLNPAKMVHIITIDLNEPNAFGEVGYQGVMSSNIWLHTLPDMSTAKEAIDILIKNDIWDCVADSIKSHLTNQTDGQKSLVRQEFENMDCRIFGIMPNDMGFLNRSMEVAQNLGYEPHLMTRKTFVEASQAGNLISRIAVNVANENQPFKAPCALFMTGELVVKVEDEPGIGGRNQEFALSAATIINGNKRIVIASADTDGTDGPGGDFNQRATDMGCKNLAGGVVDGYTLDEAEEHRVDVIEGLKTHGTSDVLWKLDCGIWASQSISIQDLIVILIMDHDG